MPNSAIAGVRELPAPDRALPGVVYVRCPHPLTGPWAAVVECIVETLDRHGYVVRFGRGEPPAGADLCGAILIGAAAPVPCPSVVIGDDEPAAAALGASAAAALLRSLA
ncbi:hypothetical protein ACQP2P_22975 [Dactylosporangium sp. CA-139114]|uniref:hypothetical protein n=1 Tax=Dactylosporangium sp. CA-139114 TaxID=3239931 RepID=UPI003D95E032